jgi:hypothetical protein
MQKLLLNKSIHVYLINNYINITPAKYTYNTNNPTYTKRQKYNIYNHLNKTSYLTCDEQGRKLRAVQTGIKFNRGSIAQLSWAPENFQIVTQLATEILNISIVICKVSCFAPRFLVRTLKLLF